MRLNLILLLLSLAFCGLCTADDRGTFLDALETGIEELRGVIKSLFKDIPTPVVLLDILKQLTFGLPPAVLFITSNFLCSAALSENAIQSDYVPTINDIQLQLRTACNRYNYPLMETAKLIENPDFDILKKVVIAVAGWNTFANTTDLLEIVSKAYNCRTDYNFMVLDTGYYLDTSYSGSAINTQLIGKYLAIGLQHLIEIVPAGNIHLVGHSFGAHIVGIAGYYFTQFTGEILPRITGLDPANVCFDEGHALMGIFRGNAEFVDIIHTTPGIGGQLGPLGDVDFYPAGFTTLKPGCFELLCSHNISWNYYAESVYPNNEYDFLATRCTSLTALNDGQCQGEPVPMGFATPSFIKGDFFLNVNAQQPYGQNATEDFQSFSDECGKCKEGTTQ